MTSKNKQIYQALTSLSLFDLPLESSRVTWTLEWDWTTSNNSWASLLKTNTMGMLTSSTPSPLMENNGLLEDVVPLLLSITIPPLAPAFSKIRALSKMKLERASSFFPPPKNQETNQQTCSLLVQPRRCCPKSIWHYLVRSRLWLGQLWLGDHWRKNL